MQIGCKMTELEAFVLRTLVMGHPVKIIFFSLFNFDIRFVLIFKWVSLRSLISGHLLLINTDLLFSIGSHIDRNLPDQV